MVEPEDFPVLHARDVVKAFPDLRTGDVVKVSGDMLGDVDVGQSVTIRKTDADHVAIARDVDGEAPYDESEVRATVSVVDEAAVTLHVTSGQEGDRG